MDTKEADAIVNRDDPIPLLRLNDGDTPRQDVNSSNAEPDKGSRRKLSPQRLKERLEDLSTSEQSPRSRSERLFSLVFQQIFPSQEEASEPEKVDRRSRKYVDRPNFSLPLMSSNFRRFNARIGVVFVFQNRLIKLFSWKAPTETLSFLVTYTLCCIDPNLLAVLPLVGCLFFVMVPAFIARHPPPPNSMAYAIQGPALAPPPNIKPAPEMSKDFFRNMRDLQNSMEDFSQLHDRLVNMIAPVTNFSNERLSSVVFLMVFSTACLLFIAGNVLQWRIVFLVLGWVTVGSMHPAVLAILAKLDHEWIKRNVEFAAENFSNWCWKDIILDELPEMREVEMFELQRYNSNAGWEAWIFSTNPYDPQSPLRIAGDRPRGARFFEDVNPPKGWVWADKKWTLDLLSRDWVEERMITAVEIETEGERWVYDIGGSDNGEDTSENSQEPPDSPTRKSDWEESSGLGKKGDWRRRRWVRLVKRRATKKKELPKQ